MRLLVFGIAVACAVTGCTRGGKTMAPTADESSTIKVTSSAFEPGASIPREYTCDGQNSSPPLSWTGIPASAKSIALIVDDPDAPAGTWVHWLVYSIPSTTTVLTAAVPKDEMLADSVVQGRNSGRSIGYQGPCPPFGTHRYFFRLFALDIRLALAPGATRAELEQAMAGHILARGELMGRYQRQRR